jgi:hypothetical protein
MFFWFFEHSNLGSKIWACDGLLYTVERVREVASVTYKSIQSPWLHCKTATTDTTHEFGAASVTYKSIQSAWLHCKTATPDTTHEFGAASVTYKSIQSAWLHCKTVKADTTNEWGAASLTYNNTIINQQDYTVNC